MVNIYQPQFFVIFYAQSQDFSLPSMPLVPTHASYQTQSQYSRNSIFSYSKQFEADGLPLASKAEQIECHRTAKRTEASNKISSQNLFVAALESECRKKKLQPKYPYQNAMRNILPNIIHQLFCFVNKQKRSRHVVDKFLSLETRDQGNRFQADRFYSYQKLIKSKASRYLNTNSLRELNIFQEPRCEIFSHNEQCCFIRMNRVLARYFLEHEFERVVLTSYRMSPETRMWNLQLRRKILDQLNQIFRPN